MKYSTDDGQTWNDYYISALDSMPLGSIILYAGDSTNVPAGWMICDGTSLSEEEYPALYDILGYKYGGSGTSFNLPNFKGRIPVGLDSAQTEFDNLGETGGSKTHNHDNGSYFATMRVNGNNIQFKDATHDWTSYFQVSGSNAQQVTINQGYAIDVEGTSGTSSNIQPYIVVNYIIKVEQLTPVLGDVLNSQSSSSTDTYSCSYINNMQVQAEPEIAVSTTTPTGEECLWINPDEVPGGSLNPITNEYSVATDKGYSCNYLNGVVLYNDNSGTTGNITLSDTTANYRYIEIYTVDNDSRTRYFDVFKFNASSSTFNMSSCSASANNFAIFTALYTNNGTTLTNGGHYLYNGSLASYPVIRVMKIIGYK